MPSIKKFIVMSKDVNYQEESIKLPGDILPRINSGASFRRMTAFTAGWPAFPGLSGSSPWPLGVSHSPFSQGHAPRASSALVAMFKAPTLSASD